MANQAITGNLERVALASVLRKIYLTGVSGVLDLKLNRDQRMIAFVDGEVRSARSNNLEKRVGQYALTNELISRFELMRAMSLVDKKAPIGQKLIQVGALTEEQLDELLQGLVREIVTECFGWKTGDFSFRQGKPSLPEQVEIRVSTADIIFQGFKKHGDERRARKIIGDLNSVLVPNPNLRLLFQQVNLSEHENAILDKIDGSLTATELSSMMAGEQERNIVIVGALLACGLLSVRKAGDSSVPMASAYAARNPEEQSQASEIPEKQEREKEKSGPGQQKRMRRPPRRKAVVPAKQAARNVTRGEAGKVRPKAVSAPSKAAAPVSDKHSKRDVELIRDTIRQKYAIVNSRKFDYYTLLGLPYRTTQKEIYYSFTTLCMQCHPDLALKEDFADLKRELVAIFSALEDAYGTLMDATKREAYDKKNRF